jgi:hypothetical protein
VQKLKEANNARFKKASLLPSFPPTLLFFISYLSNSTQHALFSTNLANSHGITIFSRFFQFYSGEYTCSGLLVGLAWSENEFTGEDGDEEAEIRRFEEDHLLQGFTDDAQMYV